MQPIHKHSGLTLIEVLVALALWGLLATLMTQGLDVITRSQRHQSTANDAHARLQSSLAQWQTDLNQLDSSTTSPTPLDWNGQVLRLLRYTQAPNSGYRQVVAWGLRDGHWVRWQSPLLNNRAEWDAAWQAALTWFSSADGGQSNGNEDWIKAAGWRIFFYRNDSWSNALSSSGTTTTSTPDAIRLELDLSPQGSWNGTLHWDWVRPTWNATRS
jgi:general secretion pathway protein J